MTTTNEERQYAMGVLAAKNAMRNGNAFATMIEQAEEVLAKEPPEAEAQRLRTALVTVKVNLINHPAPMPNEIVAYITEVLEK